ncbi:hypothetical protein ACLOJK_011373 [Asimina triloba]
MEAALFSTPETTLSNTLSSAPISAVDLEVVEEPSAGDRSVDFVKIAEAHEKLVATIRRGAL